MRVLIFTWEYPPRVVGQLADYVNQLSNQLVQNKVETYVITYHDFSTGLVDEPSGVKAIRVANPVRTHIGVLTWVLTLNQEIERAAATIYYQNNKQVDLIDVYDWHFIPAAVTLKNGLGVPFIYSVESLEDHRSPTSNTAYSMAIKSIEWLGFFEASKISVKSQWMKDEIIRIYNVPQEKITITNIKQSPPNEILKLYRSILGGTKR
jgi:hypothetical protein